ncbi:insulinase family protein [Sessilibacter corallicola]|uniref:Insulinase family protein n=1 Tax=Sessilibacter corallicola TaxID=2904075 RepID=A0ABQ0ADY4_9GAMM
MQLAAHPAFEPIQSKVIESLNITVEEYAHKKTGAQHIHIQADNNENVFLVALRTVPMDSSGVAHILEHTALCGSKKYPVRDPFFMMIRRSLNTFMNAFTSSDWTAYPFASQNRKDFNNLLDVYLDAVFFSRLDELDFAQEGHRVEFEKPDDPTSPLVFKGVVFNEMKGAMSSVPSQLWHTMCKYLFPTTTYHYNSGGDPEAIPDLSYDQLKSFYKNHYHPSNAIFMTYGDISAAEHQEKFENQALSQFDRLNYTVSVGEEKRYHAPLRVEECYPLDDSDDLNDKTHIVIGWLLGTSTDLDSVLQAQLLNSILLDNSASPLQHLLETSDLGTSPSPMCGLDDSQKELSFLCGIEGSNTDKINEFEAQILSLVEKIAEEGVPQEQLDACLHQLELHQREIGGDGYPYGLQLILSALNSATHRGNPIELLDLEPALERLRDAAKAPDFVQNLIKKLLLNNPHRVTLAMRPDTQISDRKQAAEKLRLSLLKDSLNDEQKSKIVDQAAKLVERQNQVDDESILPKVTVSDVPASTHYCEGNTRQVGDSSLSVYNAGTNGLVYQQMVIDLPELSPELLQLLPLYSVCLTELGVGEKDYLAVQQWQANVAGSFNAFSTIRGKIDDVQNVSGVITLSGKALARNQSELTDLMQQTLDGVRFDEHARIKELVAQIRARREMSVTGSGHSLAMAAACAGMSAGAKISHTLSGLAGIQALKALDDSIKSSETELADFAENLAKIHNVVKKQTRQFFLATEEHHLDNSITEIEKYWHKPSGENPSRFSCEPVNATVNQAWITNTQVNFCAKAYPTVPMTHADAPVLTVLAGFLRNGFLHRSIREQGGAYGGGASHDSSIGSFRFFSYRDPRLEETLADFDTSIDWLLTHDHSAQSLEEAILGVVASLDKPSSPAGEAKQTFHAELFGKNQSQREEFRKRILAVSIEDLKRVAKQYLTQDKASVAVVSNSNNAVVFDKLELDVQKL